MQKINLVVKEEQKEDEIKKLRLQKKKTEKQLEDYDNYDLENEIFRQNKKIENKMRGLVLLLLFFFL